MKTKEAFNKVKTNHKKVKTKSKHTSKVHPSLGES